MQASRGGNADRHQDAAVVVSMRVSPRCALDQISVAPLSGRATPSRSRRPAFQRTGGAYWMPPLVQRLFSPRGIASMDLEPILVS